MNYGQYQEVEKTIKKAYQNWYGLNEAEKDTFKKFLLKKRVSCLKVYDEQDYKAAKEKFPFVSNEQKQVALTRMCFIYESYMNEGSAVGVSYGEEGFAIWIINETKTANAFLTEIASFGVVLNNH